MRSSDRLADVYRSEYWLENGRWWHPFITLTVLANIGVALILATGEQGRERILALVAAGLLTLVPIVWFAFGIRSLQDRRRGLWLLAILTVIVGAAIVLLPAMGFVQMIIYPLVWAVFSTVWRSIVVSVVIAVGIGVVSVAFNGTGRMSDIVPGQFFSIAASCGIGITLSIVWRVAEERRLLIESLTASQARVQELSRLSGASVEKERISRDIHDTLAQTLAGLALLADRSAKELGRLRETAQSAAEPADAGANRVALDDALRAQEERADRIASLARDAHAEARELIAENAPVRGGDEHGITFAAALERLVARFEREAGVHAEVRIDLRPGTLSREDEVVLLRCAQEALSNASRHASASAVQVTVTTFEAPSAGQNKQPGGVSVELRITDDGRGFIPETASDGFGLQGIRERAAALDGTMHVDSSPDHGTIVIVRIPAQGALL